MPNTETREEMLERLLAELVDSVVGINYHDLANHCTPEEVEEIVPICKSYWTKVHGRKTANE